MTRDEHFSKANRNGQALARRTRQTGLTRATGSHAAAGRGSGRISAKPGGVGRLKKVSSVNDRKRSGLSIANLEFYRPLKKPITLRLDADVLAWFKKDGRRYQTRINQALREVMGREMRRPGK